MNIGIDIRPLMEKNLTGVGEYTLNLLQHLFETDKQNQYYLFYNSSRNVESEVRRFSGENIHYCRFRWPNKLLSLTLVLFKYPKFDKWINKKYKVVIDKFFFPNIGFLSCTCPYIITAHDLSFEFFPEFLGLRRRLWHKLVKAKQLFAQAEKVIAVSKNTKRDLVQLYDLESDNVVIIYSGINSNFRQVRSDDPRLKQVKQKYALPSKFVLYLGTIEPRKNVDSLIQAFSEINTEIGLVIAGKRGWKIKTRDKQTSKIIWTGFVPDKDKRYLYNLASIFVFPSYYEGFGFPPLEAAVCGCPVIASNNSSLTEVCSGFATLVDAHNIADIAEAIKQNFNSLISNEQITSLRSKFDWSKTAEQFLDLVK